MNEQKIIKPKKVIMTKPKDDKYIELSTKVILLVQSDSVSLKIGVCFLPSPINKLLWLETVILKISERGAGKIPSRKLCIKRILESLIK